MCIGRSFTGLTESCPEGIACLAAQLQQPANVWREAAQVAGQGLHPAPRQTEREHMSRHGLKLRGRPAAGARISRCPPGQVHSPQCRTFLPATSLNVTSLVLCMGSTVLKYLPTSYCAAAASSAAGPALSALISLVLGSLHTRRSCGPLLTGMLRALLSPETHFAELHAESGLHQPDRWTLFCSWEFSMYSLAREANFT